MTAHLRAVMESMSGAHSDAARSFRYFISRMRYPIFQACSISLAVRT